MGKNSLSRYGKKQPFPAIPSFPFPDTLFPFPFSHSRFRIVYFSSCLLAPPVLLFSSIAFSIKSLPLLR